MVTFHYYTKVPISFAKYYFFRRDFQFFREPIARGFLIAERVNQSVFKRERAWHRRAVGKFGNLFNGKVSVFRNHFYKVIMVNFQIAFNQKSFGLSKWLVRIAIVLE